MMDVQGLPSEALTTPALLSQRERGGLFQVFDR
jgi:hypothetical protein